MRRLLVHRRAAGHGEDGASAVEYGLLITGIAAVVVALIFALGGLVGALFDDSCEQIATEATIDCDG